MNDDDRTPRPQSDTDPQETREWLDSLEYVLEAKGVDRATYLFERLRDRLGASGAQVSAPTQYALHQYASPPPRNRPTPAISKSNAGSGASSAGTPWRWSSTPTSSIPASADTFRPSPRRPRCTKSPSTISSGAKTAPQGGDQVYFQGHATPGIYARAFLEGRLRKRRCSTSARNCAGGGAFPLIRIPS